jgi:hypothetical protein
MIQSEPIIPVYFPCSAVLHSLRLELFHVRAQADGRVSIIKGATAEADGVKFFA